MDRLYAIQASDGRQHYAHNDALGNVIALTDSNRVVTRTYQYDEWGRLEGGTDPGGLADRDRARFKGALWLDHPGIDMYFMRNRWYEARSGRFLSEDPIGMAGGVNSYIIAAGDPVNLRDPSGTTPEDSDSSGVVGPEWRDICPLGGVWNFDTHRCERRDGVVYSQYDGRFYAHIINVNISTIERIRAQQGFVSAATYFFEQVRPGGLWDYKSQVRATEFYQMVGNMNYGATGLAAGFPQITLLKAAGWVQLYRGTSDPSWGDPFSGPPYGDDPIDQQHIREGFLMYLRTL